MKRGWCTRSAGTLEEHWLRYVGVLSKTECWIWHGPKDKDGYGKICHNGKHMRGHRVSYQLYVGDIPKGHMVCHHCDNPSCVNPNHLFTGTCSDNMADMVQKERGPLQKLSVGDVSEIRALLSSGAEPKELASRFNVHPITVRRIRSGERWGHLAEADT